MTEREAFEAWARARGLIYESHGLMSVSSSLELFWQAWQASRAQPAPITSETGNQAAQGASAITSESAPLLSQAEICDLLDDAQVPDMPDGYTGLDMRIARIVEKAVRSKLGAGVPMTPAELDKAMQAMFYPARNRAFVDGVRAAEAFHGIGSKT